jgi:hypothetical protein
METTESIARRAQELLASLPRGVELLAAAKTRTAAEVEAVIAGGVRFIGYNYVQEAARIKPAVQGTAEWHLIGHLQRNKVKQAIRLFDMIQTVDSLRLAQELEKRLAAIDRVMPVLIEVNSGREPNKTGVLPEDAPELVRALREQPHLHVRGLMTMGVFDPDPERIRPCFRLTRRLFEELAELECDNVRMEILSMGMSDSYRVAIEEGATMVRIGTALFGPRQG